MVYSLVRRSNVFYATDLDIAPCCFRVLIKRLSCTRGRLEYHDFNSVLTHHARLIINYQRRSLSPTALKITIENSVTFFWLPFQFNESRPFFVFS